jgi:hypothetical protein
MTVVFMRWLQRNTIQAACRIAVTTGNDLTAPPLCKEFALLRGELATTALQLEQQQMIIEPTHYARCACACVEQRRRDRLKGAPSWRKTGQRASAQTYKGGMHDDGNQT